MLIDTVYLCNDIIKLHILILMDMDMDRYVLTLHSHSRSRSTWHHMMVAMYDHEFSIFTWEA